MKIQTNHLIPLEGARNIRDLGGYPAQGGVTRTGLFLRGDSTADLTDRDIETLRGMGLSLVLDLRSDLEVEHSPSRLRLDGIDYVHISMLDHINSGPLGGRFPTSMGELYESLLEYSKDDYRDIFTRMALCSGACLFHCTAGKDRTGVVAMLLLKLAGVPDKIVVGDYVATDAFMRGAYDEQIQRFARKGIRVPAYTLRADRENIVYVLDRLEDRFGGAERYLRGCGVTPAHLEAIRERFVG